MCWSHIPPLAPSACRNTIAGDPGVPDSWTYSSVRAFVIAIGSPRRRPWHRARFERLPDAVHVLLVLASHGQQGKGRDQPGQALGLELQGGGVARPWGG